MMKLKRLRERVETQGAYGLTATARCPVCGKRTHSTVLWESGELGDDLVEMFCCQHCHALIAETNLGASRQPTPAELRAFRTRWPLMWKEIEEGQRAWRAARHGFSIRGEQDGKP